MKTLLISVILVVACLLVGCGQGMVNIKRAVRNPDGTVLVEDGKVVMETIFIKVNTFAKDIKLGEYEGKSHPFTLFYPPLFVETESPTEKLAN